MSLISIDTVARIESWMDPLEIYACIFLLYENVDTALQVIGCEIQTCRRYLPVLDSVLFKGEVSIEGPLTKWSKSAVAKADPHWQDRLLEALMIIKDFWIVKYLNASKRDLEIKFLPSQANTSYHIDLVRKVLYLMVDDLTKDEWSKLREIIIMETKLQTTSSMFTEIPECLMLLLMSQNLIHIKKKNQSLNLSLLVSCLEKMGKYYWADQLNRIENLDKGACFDGQNSVKNAVSKTKPSTRFNLDCENPGTILIFNVEDYCAKVGNGPPLNKREGSHMDKNRLQGTFDLLGFKSIVVPNPKAEEIILTIRQSLEKFCLEAKQSKQERCFAVAILAHGDKDGFYCTDRKLVSWDSVRAELRQHDTKGLPRLLLIQACKGASQVIKSSDVEEDGVAGGPDTESQNLKDLFEFSSSVLGFASYRSILHGSFFIRSFCKQVLLFGSECDLYHITTRINDDLNGKVVYIKDSEHRISMTAELTGTASKLLYLSVPQSAEQKAKDLVQQWEDVEKTECKQREQQKYSLYLPQNEDVKSKAKDGESSMTKTKPPETSEETGEDEHEESRPFNLADLKKELLEKNGVKKRPQ